MCIVSFRLQAQKTQETKSYKYPYHLPIGGGRDKVYGRGYDLPLPIGIGVNYVFNEMFLDISEFGMSINNVDLSPLLNMESLGFKKNVATSSGVNLRIDGWVIPFLNVYGLFSQVSGSTSVRLAPAFGGIKFPEFGSTVDFDASAYGLGATLVYGYKNYFISGDINHSWTSTELLTKQVEVLTMSGRVGRSFKLKRDQSVVFYVGLMYRNFTKAEGNSGAIKLNDALPGIEDAYNNWYNGLTPIEQKTLNRGYNQIEDAVYDKTGEAVDIGEGNLFRSNIGYTIKKELIQTTSFQFGGQFEFDKRWALRGEFGIAKEIKFILFGLNYRLGI